MFRSLLCLALCALPVLASPLTVQRRGKPAQSWTLESLKKSFGHRVVEAKGQLYQAVPLQPLLRQTYGKALGDDDVTYMMVCSDGYRSPVRATDLVKHPAFLAYASADKHPFRMEGKPLGPFFLVWDTKRNPERSHEAPWPFQITSLERTSFSDLYGRTLPPPRASAQVLHGFTLFRRHCLSCHQVNGQGGAMAIDLNSPQSVTEYIRPEYLKRIISNPQKVRGRATMPGLDPTLPNRQQAIDDIVAYLRAKAAQRRESQAKGAGTGSSRKLHR